MNKNSDDITSAAQPTHEQVSIRAELLWKAQGSPSGRDEEIWLEAERQLFDEARELIAPSSQNLAEKKRENSETSASGSAEQMTPKRSGNGASKRRASSGR